MEVWNMVSKLIKKLVLISLVVVVPAQTIPLSLPSFSSIQNRASQFFSTMKETIKKNKTTVAVAIGSCIATCACALGFKNKKTTSQVALGGFIVTGLSKVYSNWKEAKRQKQQEEREQDEKIAAENRREGEKEAAERIATEYEQEENYRLERDLKESLSQMGQTLEVMRKTEQLERANNRIIPNNFKFFSRKEESHCSRYSQSLQEKRRLEFEKRKIERRIIQGQIQNQRRKNELRKRRREREQERRAGEENESSNLAESFYQVSRSEMSTQYSPLTYSYLQALYNPRSDISLEEVIAQANSYSPQEREKLAKIMPHEIGVETADEIRAFEFIESGYANLAHILQDRVDAIAGYNRVASMPDEEYAEMQSDAKTKEKEEIRQDYLRSITSVVWALYDCALRTGDAFTQGAFNLQNKKLQDFFLHYIIFTNPNHKELGLLGGNCNHPHAYQRISSHLSALSKEQEILQYGIDIRFGENGAARNFLPNNMTHILFIPYNPENNKFILKPEDDCMYNFGEIAQHGVGLVRSKLEGLVGSAVSEKHQRKERIPKEVIDTFNELIDKSSVTNAQQEQYKKEVKAWGIQKIVSLENEFAVDSPMRQYIDELKKEKHAEMRFGREVIFSEEELNLLINV